jgi:hypothetical protein
MMNKDHSWGQGDLGFFGNIWVRQNNLGDVGESNRGGHKHKFDHISLLTNGRVLVEVEGKEPKEFTAPTFIVIRKDQKHKFTALEPNTIYFCVFAIRDLDGEIVEDVYGNENDPIVIEKNIDLQCSRIVPDNYFTDPTVKESHDAEKKRQHEQRRNDLENKTSEHFDAD